MWCNFLHWDTVLCRGIFIIGENNLFFGLCSSISSTPRGLASADSSRKFYLLLFPLGSATTENTRRFYQILKVHSEKKLSLSGKMKCPFKSNRKELEKSPGHLGTHSCWYQIVQEPMKKPELKRIFLREDKLNLQSWENAGILKH